MNDAAEVRFLAYEQVSREWAQAQANYEQLDEFRKAKKAMLMQQAEFNGKTSAAIQERDAYASKDYRDFLDTIKTAQELALGLKQQLKAMEMRFEWSRTLQATRRAEMNLR